MGTDGICKWSKLSPKIQLGNFSVHLRFCCYAFVQPTESWAYLIRLHQISIFPLVLLSGSNLVNMSWACLPTCKIIADRSSPILGFLGNWIEIVANDIQILLLLEGTWTHFCHFPRDCPIYQYIGIFWSWSLRLHYRPASFFFNSLVCLLAILGSFLPNVFPFVNL